jgi:HK97 gp10 family phage protein
MKTTFKFEGFQEFEELIDKIQDDFGPKDATNILRNGARKSMTPVLATAKELVRKDTGQLAATLQIEARKPTNKDKHSRYVSPSEIMMARVSVAPGSKFHPKSFHNLHSKKGSIKQFAVMDARTIVNEFGTAKMPAKPYLRPALETNIPAILSSLSNDFGGALEKYRSKHMKETK